MQPTEQHEELEFEVVGGTVRMSKTIGGLMDAVAEAQYEMEPAKKDSKNPDKGSSYASLAAVIDAAKVYAKHGVAILQPAQANGSQVTITTLIAKGNEWIASDLTLTAMRIVKGGAREAMLDPQGIASAITYARRYALCSNLLVPQDDDDGEKASKAAKEATAQALAEKEAASMFGATEAPKSADVPPPVAKAEDFKKLNKRNPEKAQASADLANKRIAEEQAKLDAIKAAPPVEPPVITDRLAWFIHRERKRGERINAFTELKRDIFEMLGEEVGHQKYYDALNAGGGAKHANEFQSLPDAVVSFKMLLDLLEKPQEATSTVGAEDDWLPGVIGTAVAA